MGGAEHEYSQKERVIKGRIHGRLVRIVKWEDPGQTAFSEAVCSGSAHLSKPFCLATRVQNLKTFTVLV